MSEVLDLCKALQNPLPEMFVQYESKISDLTKTEIKNQMKNILELIIREEIDQGLFKENKLIGDIMVGHDDKKMY